MIIDKQLSNFEPEALSSGPLLLQSTAEEKESLQVL